MVGHICLLSLRTSLVHLEASVIVDVCEWHGSRFGVIWPSVTTVQLNLFNSSQRKSQWKASVKRWVLSPARNWLQLMDGERRWSGSEFQTTGAAMKKLRLTSLVVLVRSFNPTAYLYSKPHRCYCVVLLINFKQIQAWYSRCLRD